MIRKAKLEDVNYIKTIIDQYAEKHELLPRSFAEIIAHIRDFFVYEKKGKVKGCIALHFSWTDMGEIRSLAVAKEHHGNGVGKELLQHALAEAGDMNLKKVFTLTYRQGFFEKSNFKVIDKSELPQKIWGDCVNCTKFPNCDETALELLL
ncbi:GNAT family N-acetyltransferase [bacterium]|nr:GNAT family N-acetyltransferase [bacterium]|tara:strand:+ start:12634 stop:13083 length:450 start_codon:yes stop_codon:yes gene_type:complete